jgi:hypothetical protein
MERMKPRIAIPPEPSDPLVVGAMLSVFSTVLTRNSAIYVSSPLTTGKRARLWREDGDTSYEEFLATHVVAPNRKAAADFVALLRDGTSKPVIDPTALDDVEGWDQGDYLYFWGNVISRFAERVVLRDGWEFSRGCSYEFAVARRMNIQCVREDGSPLSLADGVGLIRLAVREEQEKGLDTSFHEELLAWLGGVGAEVSQ